MCNSFSNFSIDSQEKIKKGKSFDEELNEENFRALNL